MSIQGGCLIFAVFFQVWTERAERIQSSAPLPEEPVIPLLEKMLGPAPYRPPEKKAKKKAKGAKGGPRRKGASDVTSEDEVTLSSAAEDNDDDEEEENNPPPDVGKKKRAASTNLEAETSKKGKGSLADNSAWDVDSSPEQMPRTKPRAAS